MGAAQVSAEAVAGQMQGLGGARETDAVRSLSRAHSDPRAPQMPWLAVYLTVKDMDASLEFYERAFGFVPGMVLRDDQGRPQHAEMQYKGEISVMFTPETAPDCATPSPATLGIALPVFFYLYHDDVDALFRQATAAGAQVEMEPADMFWGDRVAAFVCPNGYRWSFATHIAPQSGAAA